MYALSVDERDDGNANSKTQHDKNVYRVHSYKYVQAIVLEASPNFQHLSYAHIAA